MKPKGSVAAAIGESAAVRLHRTIIRRIATRAPEFIDITDEVRSAVRAAGIQDGTVTVFSRHTTAAVKINENEPLLLRDMARFLECVAPPEGEYRHNDFAIRTANMTEDECPNGHSHCQHLLLSASETVPVADGEPVLGRWQSVFLVELDRPREREVVIQVVGF
jgi:secondary thiamine-phosphate synthase enzyme